MKNLRLIAVSFILAAIFSVSAVAQNGSGNKVFIIDTGEFTSRKNGIKKFMDAFKQLETEMKPKATALETLGKKIQAETKKFQTLNVQYQKNPKGPISPESLKQKAEVIEKMQIEYKRQEEDAKLAVAKREKELFDPIRKDIYIVMRKYAKEKGYPIILDLVELVKTNLILAIGDNQVNLTKEFIAYYNSQS